MQFINGDPLPDAPELAQRGEYKVGVRTIEILHKDQIDILNSKDGKEQRYDRRLKLEVWYPAIVPQGKEEIITYKESRGTQGDPKKPFIQYSFSGRALWGRSSCFRRCTISSDYCIAWICRIQITDDFILLKTWHQKDT